MRGLGIEKEGKSLNEEGCSKWQLLGKKGKELIICFISSKQEWELGERKKSKKIGAIIWPQSRRNVPMPLQCHGEPSLSAAISLYKPHITVYYRRNGNVFAYYILVK